MSTEDCTEMFRLLDEMYDRASVFRWLMYPRVEFGGHAAGTMVAAGYGGAVLSQARREHGLWKSSI